VAQSRDSTDITDNHVMPNARWTMIILPRIFFFSRFVNLAYIRSYNFYPIVVDMVSWSYTTQRCFSGPHAETDIDMVYSVP